MLHKDLDHREQRLASQKLETSKILCGEDNDDVNITFNILYTIYQDINYLNSNNQPSNYRYPRDVRSNISIYASNYHGNGPALATDNNASSVNDNHHDTLLAFIRAKAVNACIEFCGNLQLPAGKCHRYLEMNDSFLSNKILALHSMINMKCMHDYNTTCENTFIHQFLVGYCFPVLLMICVMGNMLNLLVYMGKEMRKSSTVKMLMAKSIVNILFMMFLLPFSLIQLSDGRNSLVDEESIWLVWPYFTACSNIAGFCAAWLTVMMTLERYLFIIYPLRSRRWCTTKHFCIAFCIIFVVACVIYIEIPFVRVNESVYCSPVDKNVHKSFIKKDMVNGIPVYQIWEFLYYWSSVILYVIAPSLLLAYCGVRSAYELICRTLPTYTDTKQCVTRITLATTCCHLTLESPALLTYIMAAINGPGFMNTNYSMCVCHVIINFAVQMNASVCFLIYMSCSVRFRAILYSRLRLLSPYGNKSSGMNGSGHLQPAISTGQRHSEHLLMCNNWSTVSQQTPNKDDEEHENPKASQAFL